MRRILAACLTLIATLAAVGPADAASPFPHVVIVTIDTLRPDRLSSYGYERPTSPEIDELFSRGIRFTEARTIEPLTNPALSSMLTSLYPHEHGATRNGLRVRPGLVSLPKLLADRGFDTAAFVGNWTLKDEISGLSEHFDRYEEVFSRKRWLFLKSEATAEDLTDAAVEWLEEHRGEAPHRRVLLWVHYVEPHEPYRRHEEVLDQLGYPEKGALRPDERYDTEIAFVDRSIGRLLDRMGELLPAEETLVAFAADHGESLGDHGYWGHGRHLYEDSLLIPMGITWPGRIEPGTQDGPALLFDLAPTILGLLDHPVPDELHGFDWSGVLAGSEGPPEGRTTFFQAHKGAVQPVEDGSRARQRGLIGIGLVTRGRKEVYRVDSDERTIHELAVDPHELRSLVDPDSEPSPALEVWLRLVEEGLETADSLPAPDLDPETEEQMRALGYID